MLRPEPMPAAAMASPAAETDTSCLGFFSRRIGLISLCCIVVVSANVGFPFMFLSLAQWRRKLFSSGGEAYQFARAPESAGPTLRAEGPLYYIDEKELPKEPPEVR